MFSHRKQAKNPAPETTTTESGGKKRRRLPILLVVLAAGAAVVKLVKSRTSHDQPDGSSEVAEPARGVTTTPSSAPEAPSAAERVAATADSAQQERAGGSNRPSS
jgi:uncharacterized protein HemX